MVTTIVVGTDGSHTAQRALRVAADLARDLDADLHVVHGYHVPQPAGGGPMAAGGPEPALPVWHEVSEALLDDALDDPELAGARIERHSVPGNASHAIVHVATQVGADLIVVGNRGMRGPRGPADSVPDAVVRQAPCHVLIAKTT